MSSFQVAAERRTTSAVGGPYRVMVVDDSAVSRGFLARTLETDPEIAVVASAGNGEMALAAAGRSEIDVIVLDIEMPVMDGMTALPKLLQAEPGVKIIMASTLTRKNAQISFQALAAGASDYVTKPSSANEINLAADFRHELVAKVKALGAARRAAGYRRSGPRAAGLEGAAAGPRKPAPIALRPASRVAPSVLAIGSSTGGPQALFAFLEALPGSVHLPILITQHMPPTFTTILAEHLARAASRPAAEAVNGEPVARGRIYIAPGGFHMLVESEGSKKVIRVTTDPPENFCRPAVDPMLRSLARAYGPGVVCVILTGMGADGTKGGEAVVAAGGTVIAQDEATSVVWGMPGAAAAAGIVSALLPLGGIAPHIVGLAARGST
ncbi:MAG: protein-glutamate methylesterase/protein-glutamine glutaminase [Pseudomonadota bacterium]